MGLAVAAALLLLTCMGTVTVGSPVLGAPQRQPAALEWSAPVIVDTFTPGTQGPGLPDSFQQFGHTHFFGGRGSFSSDSGRSWSTHPDATMWKMYRLLPASKPGGGMLSVGSCSHAQRSFEWNCTFPSAYTLQPGGDGVRARSLGAVSTFSGLPYPGVNTTGVRWAAHGQRRVFAHYHGHLERPDA